MLVGLVLLLPVRPAAWLATGAQGCCSGSSPCSSCSTSASRSRSPARFDPLGDPVYVGAGVSFPPRRPRYGQRLHRHRSRRAADGRRTGRGSRTPSTARPASLAATAPVAGRVVLALALVWVGCAVTGVRVAPGEPVAAATAVDLASTHVTEVRDRLRERAELAERGSPTTTSPTCRPRGCWSALRGKDVLLVFVESYGKVALWKGCPTLGPAARQRRRRQPAPGGSGLLLAQRVPHLADVRGDELAGPLDAAVRAVDRQPGHLRPAPRPRPAHSEQCVREGRLAVGGHGSLPTPSHGRRESGSTDGTRWGGWTNMGYEGPRFGYGRMPDQFALESFRRLELDRPGRGEQPVMAEMDLESSPNPWVRLPRMVEPEELGDGSVFDGMPEEGERRDDVWRDADLVKAAYVRSLRVLPRRTHRVRGAERRDDGTWCSSCSATIGRSPPCPGRPGHDVPISVIANDAAVLQPDRGVGLGRRAAAADRRTGVADRTTSATGSWGAYSTRASGAGSPCRGRSAARGLVMSSRFTAVQVSSATASCPAPPTSSPPCSVSPLRVKATRL